MPLDKNSETCYTGAMSRKRILLDIDGVCADFWQGVLDYFGPPDVPDAYSLEEAYPMRTERELQYWVDLPSTYENLIPLPQAPEGIQTLRDCEWDVLFATARPYFLKPVTLAWLYDYDMIDTFLTDGKLIHNGSKFEEAKKLNCRVAVEDNLMNAMRLVPICEKVFLIDWPYNQARDDEGIIRVSREPSSAWGKMVYNLTGEVI